MQRPPAETGVAPKVTSVSTPVRPAVLRERNDQFSLREQLHRFLIQSCIPVVTGNAPVAVALRGNGISPVHGTGTIDDAQRVTLRRIVFQRIPGHIQRLFHDVIRIQRAGISEKGMARILDRKLKAAVDSTVDCFSVISEVNRTNTNLPLTAMQKESAWLFRCHLIVIHDFRPLSHTDFYHIVHLDTKCLSLEPHRRVYLKRQALCYVRR